MGFKKVNTSYSEDKFINAARGETAKTSRNLKRDKSFLLYFTQDELERVKDEAARLGMGVNQYIRFRIFN